MVKKERMLNYFLTLFFIFLGILFLFLLVGISRFVLADSEVISTYVTSTKDLLEDVEDISNNVLVEKTNDDILFDFNSTLNYNDASYLNIKDNKSLITFSFNGSISKVNEFYVLSNENYSTKDLVYLTSYKSSGVILDFEGDELVEIFLIDEKRMVSTQKEDILGLVLYEEE